MTTILRGPYVEDNKCFLLCADPQCCVKLFVAFDPNNDFVKAKWDSKVAHSCKFEKVSTLYPIIDFPNKFESTIAALIEDFNSFYGDYPPRWKGDVTLEFGKTGDCTVAALKKILTKKLVTLRNNLTKKIERVKLSIARTVHLYEKEELVQ